MGFYSLTDAVIVEWVCSAFEFRIQNELHLHIGFAAPVVVGCIVGFTMFVVYHLLHIFVVDVFLEI